MNVTQAFRVALSLFDGKFLNEITKSTITMHRSQKSDDTIWKGTVLDTNGCLTLKQVVSSFSAPITEEHAWAVVYEMVKTLDVCLGNPSIFSRLFLATSLDHVLLHQDGHVHEKTYLQEPDSVFCHDRVPIISENKVIFHYFL